MQETFSLSLPPFSTKISFVMINQEFEESCNSTREFAFSCSRRASKYRFVMFIRRMKKISVYERCIFSSLCQIECTEIINQLIINRDQWIIDTLRIMCIYIHTFLRLNPVSLLLRKHLRFNRFDPEKRKTLASQMNFNPRSRFLFLLYSTSRTYRGATRCERGNAIDIERERIIYNRGRKRERKRRRFSVAKLATLHEEA